MKKIIAAAAGLMLTGAMISSAVAAIEFSGDARARYYYESDYNLGAVGTDDADHWNSRVRLKVKGTTAGGSFAVVRARMGSHTWGTVGSIGDADTGAGVEVFEAYVGVPMGCVLLEAGRKQLQLTNGFWNDAYLDSARVTWAQDNTTMVGLYGVLNADNNANGTGTYDSSEDRIYVLGWMQQWNDAWSTNMGASYTQLDLTTTSDAINERDNGGLILNVAAAGQAGPVALTGEIGYQADGYSASDDMQGLSTATGDDGYGAYVTAGMDFDAVNVTFVGGVAMDGYAFDAPVGFVMIGGDNQITPSAINNIGAYGDADTAVDTWFAGIKTSYQVSETLGLGMNLAYANLEASDMEGNAKNTNLFGTNEDSSNAYEISATAAYTINDGTMLYARAGYLDVDEAEDPAIGFGMSLELSF